eukprot:CAMPEP_0118709816 /NCGR_PEP_ID=MMETSP0800-20121206/22923_1 /TAXON_ID=210618 ORGANISM="Striatella unipunctata, Strain CCMP2910" /NCGR_SAMPLE_ID=MMETSP0800 /ASSEMBLY_ACC=CAM_ASM_000638 /LENGTH=116 /DNA_ID=CAMNT_0006613703 /DNA_START=45 /DNA_END=395 /DNA_ORIENTATION=+
MDQYDILVYPNLDLCQVALVADNSCLDAMKLQIQAPYDFSADKEVLRKSEIPSSSSNGTSEASSSSWPSPQVLDRAILAKMKSVTKGEEDVCIAMLKQNSYDLEGAIETFFQSEYS